MVRIITLFLTLAAVPTFAAPFDLEFVWTPVAGVGGGSADSFVFRFVDPTNQLQITNMSVTLGSGMIYDLTNSGPGYLTWGGYSQFGSETGTMTSAPLQEGSGPGVNRTAAWTFSSFVNGDTFGFGADVDEVGTCSGGLGFGLCVANKDALAPSGFVERGAIDLTFHVAPISGPGGQDFTFNFNKNDWDLGMIPLLAHHAKANFSGELDPRTGTHTPEPSTLLMGTGAAAVFALRRRIC